MTVRTEEWHTFLKFLAIILVSFSALVLGCKRVQPDDLIGTWVINDSSRTVLPKGLPNSPAKIVLNADGTFLATNMPGLFYFPGIRRAQLETGTGSWKLVSNEGGQQVQLAFQEIANWKGPLPFGTQLNVSRGWSALSLDYFLGDPDEARRVSFEKK